MSVILAHIYRPFHSKLLPSETFIENIFFSVQTSQLILTYIYCVFQLPNNAPTFHVVVLVTVPTVHASVRLVSKGRKTDVKVNVQ